MLKLLVMMSTRRDPSRANRNLNFQTTIIEGSTVLEWNIITKSPEIDII